MSMIDSIEEEYEDRIEILNEKIKRFEAENKGLKEVIEGLEKDSRILRALEAGGVDN